MQRRLAFVSRGVLQKPALEAGVVVLGFCPQTNRPEPVHPSYAQLRIAGGIVGAAHGATAGRVEDRPGALADPRLVAVPLLERPHHRSKMVIEAIPAALGQTRGQRREPGVELAHLLVELAAIPERDPRHGGRIVADEPHGLELGRARLSWSRQRRRCSSGTARSAYDGGARGW